MKQGDLIYIIGPDGYDYKKTIIINIFDNMLFNYCLDDILYVAKDNLNGVFNPDFSMHTIFINRRDVIEYYENKINKLHKERITLENLVAKINLDK